MNRNEFDHMYTLVDSLFGQFQAIVYDRAGIHLRDTKKNLVISRLVKRLRQLDCTFSDYLQLIKVNTEEMGHFIDLITTNTTYFFREKYHLNYLYQTVLPHLVNRHDGGQIRIWSAGCSTGEEPYSLAIILSEFFENIPGWDWQIMATDINQQVLQMGRQGIYPQYAVKMIPYTLLKKYFGIRKGKYEYLFKIKDELRKKVIFRQVNLSDQKTYPKNQTFDLVFCRNVFIYFDQKMRDLVLGNFYQHLGDEGYLFLGHSETLTGSTVADHWQLVDQTVYQKRQFHGGWNEDSVST